MVFILTIVKLMYGRFVRVNLTLRSISYSHTYFPFILYLSHSLGKTKIFEKWFRIKLLSRFYSRAPHFPHALRHSDFNCCCPLWVFFGTQRHTFFAYDSTPGSPISSLSQKGKIFAMVNRNNVQTAYYLYEYFYHYVMLRMMGVWYMRCAVCCLRAL